MKKIGIGALILLLIAGIAFVIYQNTPHKKYVRHITKARLFAKEKNLTAAEQEYELALKAVHTFSSDIALEYLRFKITKLIAENKWHEATLAALDFVKAYPENNEGQVFYAQLAYRTGDAEAAFEAIDKVLLAKPTHFEARNLLAQLRASQGRVDLAEDQLRLLQKSYPDSVSVLLPLVEALIKQGKVVECRAILQKVIATHPNIAQARLYLMDTYLLERRPDSAQGVLTDWKNQDSSLMQEISVRQARLYSLLNKLEDAEKCLQPYLNKSPKNIDAFSEKAILLVKRGKYDSAMQVYETMADLKANIRGQTSMLAHFIALKNQEPAKALGYLKILQVGDKSDRLSQFLVACYIAMGLENKAQELVDTQKKSSQNLSELLKQLSLGKEFIGEWALVQYFQLTKQDYWALATAASWQKKWPKSQLAAGMFATQLIALKQYKVALSILEKQQFTLPAQRIGLIDLYIQTNQIDKALILANELTNGPAKMQGLNTLLADLYIRKGQKEKAMEIFKLQFEQDPKNLVCANNLAWEYGVVQKDYSKAKVYIEALKNAKHNDPRLYDTIGWVLAMAEKWDEAETNLHKATLLIPDFPPVMYHFGYVKVQQGKKAEGKKWVDQALSSTAAFEERAEAKAFAAGI